jgi:leucyl/phenylalanyl-tRNA--protein transferase
MPVEDSLVWWSPEERAVIPVAELRASRSLRRAARGYEIRIDTAFGEVIRGCADPRRPHGWIDGDFVAAYTRLHELGWAHSVEAWDLDGLAGGLYGVSIGGLFAAESMFHRRTDASKAAFVALVEQLRRPGDASRRLLDVQWLTPHLATLGATELSRAQYRVRLADALGLRPAFG